MTEETKTTTKTGKRGRPRKEPLPEGTEPVDVARSEMAYTANRACSAINDAPNGSLVAKAAKFARNGGDRETVEKCFEGIQDALADAREAVERIFDPETPTVSVRKERISL
jgi:hypothetical protein